jgi:Trp operon repressor
MPSAPFEMTREELEALHEKFREVKHDINNTLAVIMALSELAQRNPAHYEKLGKAVLTRGPNVVQMLQDFQTMLSAKLKPGDGSPPTSPPLSGVF